MSTMEVYNGSLNKAVADRFMALDITATQKVHILYRPFRIQTNNTLIDFLLQ